tara:strand:+ start:55 stop:366 length:312 start_codon:yes stop_codon:yes gene_type:complete
MAQSKIDLENNIRDSMVKSVGGESPEIDAMSKELTNHIVEFIQAQTFTITSMNATQLGIPVTTPSGPGVTNVTVKIDEDNTAADNAFAGVESITSKVQLKTLA